MSREWINETDNAKQTRNGSHRWVDWLQFERFGLNFEGLAKGRGHQSGGSVVVWLRRHRAYDHEFPSFSGFILHKAFCDCCVLNWLLCFLIIYWSAGIERLVGGGGSGRGLAGGHRQKMGINENWLICKKDNTNFFCSLGVSILPWGGNYQSTGNIWQGAWFHISSVTGNIE